MWQSEREALERELQRAKKHTTNDKFDVSEDVKRLQSELETVKQQYEAELIRVQDHERDIAHKAREIQQLLSEKDTIQTASKASLEEISELRSALQRERDTVETLEKALAEAISDKETMEQKLYALKDNKASDDRLEAAEAASADLKRRLSEAEGERDRLRLVENELQASIEAYKDSMEKMKEEFAALNQVIHISTQRNIMINLFVFQNQFAAADLENEVSALKEKLSSVEEEKEAVVAAAKDQIAKQSTKRVRAALKAVYAKAQETFVQEEPLTYEAVIENIKNIVREATATTE